jgi:hypothetical protein
MRSAKSRSEAEARLVNAAKQIGPLVVLGVLDPVEATAALIESLEPWRFRANTVHGLIRREARASLRRRRLRGAEVL